MTKVPSDGSYAAIRVLVIEMQKSLAHNTARLAHLEETLAVNDQEIVKLRDQIIRLGAENTRLRKRLSNRK